jgi:hypothetical protein
VDDDVRDVGGVVVVVVVVVTPRKIPVVTVGEVLWIEVSRKGPKAWVVSGEMSPPRLEAITRCAVMPLSLQQSSKCVWSGLCCNRYTGRLGAPHEDSGTDRISNRV